LNHHKEGVTEEVVGADRRNPGLGKASEGRKIRLFQHSAKTGVRRRFSGWDTPQGQAKSERSGWGKV